MDDFGSFEVPEERIDRSIYAMPQWIRLPATDLSSSTRWYVDAAGFEVLVSMPSPDGTPALVHLRRFRYQDILLVRADGPVQAGTASVGFAAGSGTDLDAQARRARTVASNVGHVDGPTRTPWNTIDLTLTDPDGHIVVLSQPMPFDQADPAFSAMIRNLPAVTAHPDHAGCSGAPAVASEADHRSVRPAPRDSPPRGNSIGAADNRRRPTIRR